MTAPDEWDEPEEKKSPPLLYPDLATFVHEQLIPAYRRRLSSGRVWCRQWWKHPEAMARLDALWMAFEHLRHDTGTGMSIWWRDHVDHHMAVLLDPDGPMKGCDAERGIHNDRMEPLPCDPPPPGLFS